MSKYAQFVFVQFNVRINENGKLNHQRMMLITAPVKKKFGDVVSL